MIYKKYDSYKDFTKSKEFNDWKNSDKNKEFISTLKKKFDIILENEHMIETVRQKNYKRVISLTPFYFLSKINGKIFNIGHDTNLLKEIDNRISGIETNPLKDYNKIVNEKLFWNDHKNKFENVMSINSLHFINIKLLKARITQIKNVLKKNGSAYISMNIARLKEKSNFNNFDLILEKLIKEMKDLLNEVHLIKNPIESPLDGGIHFIFNKEKDRDDDR